MKRITDPIMIGTLNVKNRIIRSATAESYTDGGERLFGAKTHIYEALAIGEVGAIITGMFGVDENSGMNPGMPKAGDSVFLPALEDGLVPFRGMESLLSGGAAPTDIGEERRLFYVALTRAKERLFLSLAHTRNLYGRALQQKASPFLSDLPKHCLKASAMVAHTAYKEQRLSLL